MKTNHLLLILTLTVLFVGSSFAEYRADKPSGEGTKESPYLMESLENLLWLSENVTNVACGSFFLQTKDIDASETKDWRDGKGFPPIGIYDYENSSTGFTTIKFFNGTYDGNNHVIYGLNFAIHQPDVCCGLFGGVTNSIIKNIVLEDVTMNASSFCCAALAAYIVSTSISNCHVGISFTQKGDESSEIAGLVATIYKFGEISNCSAKVVNLKGGNVGGLVSSCLFSAYIIDPGAVNIRRCYTEGNISGYWAGGIVYSPNRATMDDCYSWANVSGKISAGGISAFGVNLCKNCYYYGKVENGNPISGGESSGEYSSVYYCSEQGNDPNPGVVGKTYAELLKKGTYEDWDFENVWFIEEDVSLPTLSWETPEPCIGVILLLLFGLFVNKRK